MMKVEDDVQVVNKETPFISDIDLSAALMCVISAIILFEACIAKGESFEVLDKLRIIRDDLRLLRKSCNEN